MTKLKYEMTLRKDAAFWSFQGWKDEFEFKFRIFVKGGEVK